MIWKKNFGKEIKRERMSWGMSRTKLSRLSHVDRETIIDIENGRIKNPDFYEMLNICEILVKPFDKSRPIVYNTGRTTIRIFITYERRKNKTTDRRTLVNHARFQKAYRRTAARRGRKRAFASPGFLPGSFARKRRRFDERTGGAGRRFQPATDENRERTGEPRLCRTLPEPHKPTGRICQNHR